jgi:arabinose-5-phosphate isomerase
MDHAFHVGSFNIEEADALNRAPSVSSVFFMILLDVLGIHLAERRGFTMEEFQKHHPAGDLGGRKL